MPTISANVGRFSAKSVAFALAVLLLVVALMMPEPLGNTEGGLSSYSTAPGGAGIIYDAAGRFGWHAERRITTLDSLRRAGDTRTTVQVVLAPREALGAHEIHNLLENVRRGGGLVFSLDGDDALRDSLGLAEGIRMYLTRLDADCPRGGFETDALVVLPPEAEAITWRRDSTPQSIDTLVRNTSEEKGLASGVGFRLGKGRIAIVGGSDVFSNQAVRVCRWDSDIAAMKIIEYTRPAAGNPPVLVFDEFHHGFGVHGGSLKAAATYLRYARSGHFVLQLVAAGLLLLLAMAARPLPPRDDTRVIRRSPLEHASALGHAYEEVRATRSATSTLVGGLRRRTRGIVPVSASADDDEYFDAVVRRIPSLDPTVAIVKRARVEYTAKRDFAAVGAALATIEEQLLSTPSTRL